MSDSDTDQPDERAREQRAPGDAVEMPAGVDEVRWAREQALGGAVWGAPGWFGSSSVGGPGAVNMRQVAALGVWQDQDGDGCYLIGAVMDGHGGWPLDLGPYVHEAEAGLVGQQVIRLASDVWGWPDAEPLAVDGAIPDEDLRVDVLANGAGAVATVRVVHEPTGIVVTCSDRPSERENREAAVQELTARLAVYAADGVIT